MTEKEVFYRALRIKQRLTVADKIQGWMRNVLKYVFFHSNLLCGAILLAFLIFIICFNKEIYSL